MNGNSLLLDTNIILYFLNGDKTLIPVIQEYDLNISIITEIELLGYSRLTEKEQTHINEFIGFCDIKNITKKIKRKTIEIRRNHKLKLPDSVIMATASTMGIPIITADKDFQKTGYEKLILYKQ